jgi:hypothetical protein
MVRNTDNGEMNSCRRRRALRRAPPLRDSQIEEVSAKAIRCGKTLSAANTNECSRFELINC